MNDKPGEPKKGAETGERDYSQTLFLPQTEFPMRAGLPQKEPELLKRWQTLDLYKRLRDKAKGRDKFVLHWQSVRPVPKVRIDFGNGRTLEKTLTGNSLHLVLDSDGDAWVSIERSASGNCARFAGVAIRQDAWAMPSRSRSCAPSCISVTESL